MSRTGEKPIDILSGVTVTVDGSCVVVKGAQGELRQEISDILTVKIEDGKVIVGRPDDSKKSKSLHGLSRSLIANMVEGVSKGFVKELEIEGVGFKAIMQGNKISLAVGFATPKEYTIPEGVKVEAPDGVRVVISGPDKQKVGDVAAQIRSVAPAEPYKGKGIKYKGERIRRKVGKTVA